MFSELGRLEMCCDAPPYAVVRACNDFDFHSPLDVRWCRMSDLISPEEQRNGNFGIRLWQRHFGKKKPKVQTCTCGQPLPDLQKYDFAFRSKKVGCYLLAQCRRCRTMYWDDALPLPAWMHLLNGNGIKNVVMDFHKTDYYGSTALGFFVRIWKRVGRRKGRMAFCNVSDHEQEITNLDHS